MCENWGYFRLGAFYRKESIEEMVHAEKLMDRILFLDGTPNMTDIGPIKVGTNIKAQFESDLALEMRAVKQLNDAIRVATEVGDNAELGGVCSSNNPFGKPALLRRMPRRVSVWLAFGKCRTSSYIACPIKPFE